MTHRRVIVVQRHPVLDAVDLARLVEADPAGSVQLVATPPELMAALPEAEAVITSFPLTDAMVARAPRLRWIQCITSGVDGQLPPSVIASSDIAVTASKNVMTAAVAEHAVALLLAVGRSLPAFFSAQRRRRWWRYTTTGERIPGLVGKNLFVMGVGGVGGEVARIAKQGLGMHVVGMSRRGLPHPHIDRRVGRADMHDALASADYVCLCLPLTEATRNILDAEALRALRPSAAVINVGRGKLIDEIALVEALRSGRLRAAGLDTFAEEPLGEDSPFWDLENVIITPHMAGITDDAVRRAVDLWCQNIRRFLAGEPLLAVVDNQASY